MSASPETNDIKPKLTWRTVWVNIAVAIMTFAVAISIGNIFEYFHVNRLVDDLELKTYDLRSSLSLGEPVMKPDPRIMIVKFDNTTLNMYENEYGTWPWPRNVHAEMIEFMNQCGVRMIAYDLVFAVPQKNQAASDQALVDAFSRYNNVYLSSNFDNDLEAFRRIGKPLKPEHVAQLKPLQISLDSQLNPDNPSLLLDSSGFYQNPTMTFEHFRLLLPGLMKVGKRVGFINHGKDQDGISRSNPLFFRLLYDQPIQTTQFPLHQDARTTQWLDAKNQPVTAEGFLLDKTGNPLTHREATYYPYLALRMAMDLNYPNKKLQFHLTPNGHLQFGQHDVPLYRNGNFLIHWYYNNFNQDLAREEIAKIEATDAQVRAAMEQDAQARTPENQAALEANQQILAVLHDIANTPDAQPQPFLEISASEVMIAMRHQATGQLTPHDRQVMSLLKDKLLFIGPTALATFDVKSTPIGLMTPGVMIQAHIFDSLIQNKFYMKRLSPNTDFMIMIFLSLLSAYVTYKMRSANVGFIISATIAAIYIVIAALLFKQMGIWLNIVMPVVMIAIAVMMTFMAKYIGRDRDYKRTYALATTDSMTGLYNYRFFQEHMFNSIERSKRFSHKFSLILIDIDFFKKFNDSYGHQAGDEVLRCVAKKLKACVRSVDVVARYGGEEMAVILDRATEQEALEVARKLVTEVAGEAYPISEGVYKNVTISVGVATYPTHGVSTPGLVEFADQGLYRAKENGRNQVGAQYDADLPEKPDHATAS